MTRWQVFGGIHDGLRADTKQDDETELTTRTRALHEQRLTYRDIDHAGVAITITITKEEAT